MRKVVLLLVVLLEVVVVVVAVVVVVFTTSLLLLLFFCTLSIELSAMPILLMKATANQASPAHASRVIGPTDGALKYKGLDWLSLAKRTARYPKNKADTAHTKA